MSTPPRDFAQWMRTVERKLVQAIRTGNSAAVTALNAEAAAIREEIAASGGDARIPAAPIELTVQTSLLVDNNGRTYGKLLIDFPDVTKATDATNLVVDHYELWGRDETGWDGQAGTTPEYKLMDTSELSTFYSAPYEPASIWRFRVRAIGVTTPTPGTYSTAVLVSIETDTTPPPIPSPVVLTQQYAAVAVTWDGLGAAGEDQPADYSYTEVAVAQSSSPTALYTVFRGADTTVITGLPLGVPTYVRTRSVDYSDNKSGWSAQRQITPKALVSGDISGLDVTLADQVARSEAAEAAAEASAADAVAAANDAIAAQNAAVAAQAEADAAAADAALVVADSAAINAEAAAARAAADAAAADAAAAELAATNAQTAADQSLTDLQGYLDNSGKIIRQELEPAVEDRTVNNLWIKDSTGEPYTWVLDELLPEGGSWVIVTDQRVVEMSLAADAAADAAEASELAAAAAQAASTTAEQNAAASASTASAAQSAADAAAAAANQAQAEADAAAADAAASSAAAGQAAADAEAAAISAGSSSAAALASEQAAEAANLAADAAVTQMETAIAQGSSLYPDPGFENGYGAFQQVAGKIERVQDRVHLGLWALRFTTDGVAGNLFDYPDKVPVSENSALYVEYWAYADTNWPVGGVINTYVDRFPNADGTGASSGFSTNPTVLVAGAWQKVSVYVEVGAYKSFRAFPLIPTSVNSTAGRNVWIDDFRVLDVTESYFTTKAAQTKANEANTLAGQAKDTADSALSASTHAGKAFFSADPPSGTAPLNSTWQQYDVDGDIIGAWQQTGGDATTDGGTWTKRQLTSAQFDNFDAGKITFGTMSGSRIQAGTLSISVAEVPALPTSKITNLDTNLATLDAAAQTAMLATAYSKNPSFDTWTAAVPADYTAYGTVAATKDTAAKRVGAHGANFNITALAQQGGFTLGTTFDHMPNTQYVTVEVEFMLKSGTLPGAGFLLDWTGLTPNRAILKFADVVTAPTLNKWHRITATLERPAGTTGTWTRMSGFLMANYPPSIGDAIKNITFDWLNVRPATQQEIAALLAKQRTDGWTKTGTTFIDGGQLFTDSVTTLALAANAVEADNIKAGAVLAAKLEATLVLTTKIIAGDPLGTHAVMDQNGFRVFSADPADGIPNEVVRMGVAASDDYFAITKSDGTLAATISQDGVGSFTQVDAKDALYYKGKEMQSLLDAKPAGVAAAAFRTSNSSPDAVPGGPFQPYLRVEATLYPGRLYKVWTSPIRVNVDPGNGCTVSVNFTSGATLATVSNSSPFVQGFVQPNSNGGRGSVTLQELFAVLGSSPVQYSFLLMFGVQESVGGTGAASIRADGFHPVRLVIEDVGLNAASISNGVWLNGTVAPAPAKNTYIKQYGCNNSMNYQGSNAQYAFDTGRMYQGLSPAGYGNLKSVALFPSMTADLSGATINYIRVYFNFEHWYYNSGGTARIGLHGHTGIPGSFSHAGVVVNSGGWPKPGARWVDIPAAYWDGFKSGAYRGVSLEGDGTYGTYGYAGRPTIEISYTK